MKVSRVLVAPGSLVVGAAVVLDDSERRHLRVRRDEGTGPVVALDGAGAVATGVLTRSGDDQLFEVASVVVAPSLPVTVLAVGAGDKERFLQLAERATELGVSDLVPLETARSQAVENRWRDSGRDRAIRRAREACKQSGNPWAVRVHPPCALAGLAGHFAVGRWLTADPLGNTGPAIGRTEPVGWVIGPEGGLDSAEIEFARTDLLAELVRLGPAVLRFDTAAIAAAVLTNDRRGP